MADRVATYIDGFNLYYGLKDSNFKRFYWLDIVKLARELLQAGQSLVMVKYFTARITGPSGSKLWQKMAYCAVAMDWTVAMLRDDVQVEAE